MSRIGERSFGFVDRSLGRFKGKGTRLTVSAHSQNPIQPRSLSRRPGARETRKRHALGSGCRSTTKLSGAARSG